MKFVSVSLATFNIRGLNDPIKQHLIVGDECQQNSVELEVDNKTQPMDWSKCIVCQTETGKKKKLSCPVKSKRKDTGAGYETFIKNIRLFEEAGCEELPEWIKSEAKDAETLAINEGKWHSACY
ncbi:hypothetical protein ElyMa_000536100 [Elysia marginata]|uniref:Endonuclease/exonuclease/phosphatase domain-containing protein n=1 Tax=Elysia marginata TaxID=1093978 RepID=A0AAV4FYV8_9GAST|nr:hypothetical protein ElyMa_000536100 [Elysia marginata]